MRKYRYNTDECYVDCYRAKHSLAKMILDLCLRGRQRETYDHSAFL